MFVREDVGPKIKKKKSKVKCELKYQSNNISIQLLFFYIVQPFHYSSINPAATHSISFDRKTDIVICLLLILLLWLPTEKVCIDNGYTHQMPVTGKKKKQKTNTSTELPCI